MIYRVKLDGIDIYGTSDDMTLFSPSVKIELNAAGSAEFTMPKGHQYYDLPNILSSDVEVYEDNDLIWYGRVIELEIKMNKDKVVYCEGPLAYFNDTILRPQTYENSSIHSIFEAVISTHNYQVPGNRQISVGEITVDDAPLSMSFEYNRTKEVVDSFVENFGGYLIFRKGDSGENVVDWVSDLPSRSSQPVQFGLNLVDLTQHISASKLKTAVLPIGKEIDGAKLTIAEANDGVDYIDSEAVETFGRIIEVVEFSEIALASELKTAGEKWLSNQQFDPLSIQCNAAELYYIDGSYMPFRVGEYVRVSSTPHLIDKTLPLTAIDIKLDSAVKQISIGTPEKRQITQMT